MPKLSINTTLNYSPNFDQIKRKPKQIKLVVFHYTGMKREIDAINKLTSVKSKVSSHYFIKKNGEISILVPDLYVAWHAGVSSWEKYKSINKYSIGIEISNPGHDNKYKKFSKEQINSIYKLSRYLIKKYKIKARNILGHSDIEPGRKRDPGEKFPWKYLSKFGVSRWHSLSQKDLIKNRRKKIDIVDKSFFFHNLSKIGYSIESSKNVKKHKYLNYIICAFQRRFRQELINGKIDKECLLISQNLAKKLN